MHKISIILARQSRYTSILCKSLHISSVLQINNLVIDLTGWEISLCCHSNILCSHIQIYYNVPMRMTLIPKRIGSTFIWQTRCLLYNRWINCVRTFNIIVVYVSIVTWNSTANAIHFSMCEFCMLIGLRNSSGVTSFSTIIVFNCCCLIRPCILLLR